MKLVMLTWSLLLVLTLSLSSAQAEISEEKHQEINKMLSLMGQENLMKFRAKAMLEQMQAEMPGVSADFWVNYGQKMDVHELMDRLVVIYDKYYTLDELKAINAFYASPAGQKMIGSTPGIMQESRAAGEEWSLKISQAAIQAAQAAIKK